MNILHPTIGDRVLVWNDSGTLVAFQGDAAIVRTDEETLTVPTEQLRWVADRRAWVIVPEHAA